MVSEGMTVTLIGIASGVATALTNIMLSQKIEGRVKISEREVLMAMGAVFIGSAIGYYFIKGREEATGLPEDAFAEVGGKPLTSEMLY